MSHHALHLLHLVAAAVWFGAYLLLAMAIYLPARRQNDLRTMDQVLRWIDPVALSALVVAVISGYVLGMHWLPSVLQWFQADTDHASLIRWKWLLLIGALLWSAWGRIYLLPTFAVRARFNALGVYLFGHVALGLGLIVLGTLFRYGQGGG